MIYLSNIFENCPPNNRCVKKTKISKDFSYIDSLCLNPCKPSIREILDVCVTLCNVKKDIIKTSCGTKIIVKGYKSIKLTYEACNCHGKVVNATFITPFFEILNVPRGCKVLNVCTKICYCYAELADRRTIYIYNILGITYYGEESNNCCHSCNIMPITDTIDCQEICHFKNDCNSNCSSMFTDRNVNSKEWNFRNDFL